MKYLIIKRKLPIVAISIYVFGNKNKSTQMPESTQLVASVL